MAARLGIAAIGVLLFIPVLIAAGVQGAISAVFGSSTSGVDCALAGSPAAGVAGYGPDQLANAATIVAVGKQMNVPEQGWVVAIAAAMQESGLRNLDHGDRDSLGLFQQRPSQGWGTPAQITNPAYAATQFYQQLLAVEDWQQMSINDAAQAVQRSGFPDAYAQHEQAARDVVSAVHGSTCTTTNTGVTVGTGDCTAIQALNAAALAAINYACGQKGVPYVWGADPKTATQDSTAPDSPKPPTPPPGSPCPAPPTPNSTLARASPTASPCSPATSCSTEPPRTSTT